MTKRVYFDTSALMKEFVAEVGSDLIDKITVDASQKKLQIVSSAWAINEAVAVIDRLERREELKRIEVQQIIATIIQRVVDSSRTAAFFFAPISHVLVANSRLLIKDFHISADDALHIYTGYIYDCDYFLIHDEKIIHRIRSKVAEGMTVIDLGDNSDCMHAAAGLGLSAFD